MVSAQVYMHEPGHAAVFIGVTVELDALHEGGGTIPDPDDGDSDLLAVHC
jgi:hypothetical protein